MRKGPFSIFSIAITIAILFGSSGCNLPLLEDTEGVIVVNITEVTVTPSSPGMYSLSLKYSRILSDIPVTITCSYSTPDKNNFAILTLYDDGSKPALGISTSKDFSVSQAGFDPLPGIYTATCATDVGGSSKSTAFIVGDDPNADVSIVSVTVVSGASTNFALGLVYLIRISDAVSFTCNYVTPDGATMLIGNFTDDNHLPETPVIKTLYFSISEASLKNNPGTGLYTATCQDDEGRSKKSATFTVIGPGLTPTSPSTPTLTPTVILTGGTITFDEASEVLAPHKDKFGYYPSQHHKWCNPTLNIDANGNISGTCSSIDAERPPGSYGTWYGGTIVGTVTGKLVPGSSFTFLEELIETGYPGSSLEYTRKTVITGTGSFVSATRATGTAEITAECRTQESSINSPCAPYTTTDSFTGTINWEFNGATTGVP